MKRSFPFCPYSHLDDSPVQSCCSPETAHSPTDAAFVTGEPTGATVHVSVQVRDRLLGHLSEILPVMSPHSISREQGVVELMSDTGNEATAEQKSIKTLLRNFSRLFI